MKNYSSHQIATNDINLHFIEYANADAPKIVCLHGITANCHAFDGIVSNGLNKDFHLYSVDLRGRGLSSQPAFQYTMEDHAQDILGLLDHLKIEKATLMGHSFGGLLIYYMAANYAERVEQIIVLDAAAEMNPDAIEMLTPAFNRLEKKYPSFENYVTHVKEAPYMTFWSDEMLNYYKADVKPTEEGGVTPIPNIANIIECSMGVANEAWDVIIEQIEQRAILLNAIDTYTLGQPLLPDFKAKETVEKMKDCKYVAIDGNHHTMMYETGAKEIVAAAKAFLS
ncbi:MAG TPA: alpha/beta hydrolase [Flavipsychrobacter sp.]|jgi:pimeloyl-ACP methyl ester carboxylesterase|nr:alpha/beta hydrolase [Flavipsychrobacter sp.]